MKLLVGERGYLRWMGTLDGWRSEERLVLLAHGPNRYPCYAIFSGFDDYHERAEPSYLYLADVEMMYEALRARFH